MKKQMSGRLSGFTLIELLVVVLIIGILAAVALPKYQVAVAKSRYASMKHLVNALVNAEDVYYLANNIYTDDINELDIDIDGTPSGSSQRTFSWGYCYVQSTSAWGESQAACVNNQDGLMYLQTFAHSIHNPGRVCLAYNRDLSSVANKICKSETGATTPGTGTTGAYSWVYQ